MLKPELLFSHGCGKSTEAFVEYRFIGEAPQESEIVDYELAWLPEGFSFQKEQSLGNSSYLTYAMILDSVFFSPIYKEMMPQVCL